MTHRPAGLSTLRSVLATTAMAAVGAVVLGAGHAHAATLTAGSPSIPYGGSTCADVVSNNSTPGTLIQDYACHGGSNQEFMLIGTSVLSASGTRCMDVEANGNSGALGTPVDAYNCTGGSNQSWNFTNGQLVNAQYGYCLDATSYGNGTTLVVNRCNGAASQQWQFK